MRKIYKFEVDCANCASLIEEAIQKISGIANATVNFMTQKMIIEFKDDADINSVMKDVVRTSKRIEPDCEIEL